MASSVTEELRAKLGAPVLLIEDELELAGGVRHGLETAGHPVRVTQTVDEGLQAARSRWASVLVVDRMLNGADGLSIVETLRKEGDSTPVLVISALSSVDERIGGLKADLGRHGGSLRLHLSGGLERGRRADGQHPGRRGGQERGRQRGAASSGA
jgi:CheY-like chemotaxis protein